MSDLESDGQAQQPQRETANESAETRVFDSDQILRAGMPRQGLTLRERYRLESEIGRGAMGIVFRATDLELLRPVAVKVLADRLSGSTRRQEQEKKQGQEQEAGAGREPAMLASPVKVLTGTGTSDQRSRFMREARAAAALNHPHIVAIYDVGEDHGLTARENYQNGEALGLLYSRTEGRRCLAHVHFRNGELSEALSLCEEILEMLGTKSRISRLWLGPLHIEALIQSGRRAEASERLAEYEALVSECQAPRCEREIERLKTLLS